MEKITRSHIYHIFILSNFDIYLPSEIIRLMMSMTYPKIRIIGIKDFSYLQINDHILVWGSSIQQYIEPLAKKLVNNTIIPSIDNHYLFPFYRHNMRLIANFEDIIKISLGPRYAVALLKSGDIYESVMSTESTDNPIYKINLKNIIKIKCGNFHSIALNKYGEIFTWGRNDNGQLGLATTDKYTNSPILLQNPLDITKIYCMGNSTYALTKCNDLYSWGYNNQGQLGLGHYLNQNLPQKINLENVIKVACGEEHIVAMTKSGEVYTWGSNYYGQLGLGNQDNQCVPTKVKLDFNIVKIACGRYYTVVADKFGYIYTWGLNNRCQLGLGHNANRSLPQWVNIPNYKKIRKISCGNSHTIVMNIFGEFYVWGDNHWSQTGINTTKNKKIILPQKLIFD